MAQLSIEKEYEVLLDQTKDMSTKSNADRRHLYARAQLLIMDIEDKEGVEKLSPEAQKQIETLESISKNCKLTMIRKNRKGFFAILDFIVGVIRTSAVVLFLIISGIVVAFPCFLFRPLERILIRKGLITPYNRPAVVVKAIIAETIMTLAGVETLSEGLSNERFGAQMTMLCFSHSSTLDAFLIGQLVPVFHPTLSKAELFLIPFFSQLLLAFGGLPINRKDRDQAVRALSEAAAGISSAECVCVSPEGTRSLSGHILPFKKGPFYMWEQLKVPVIPMVIIGAYDLYPPGRNIPFSGKLIVKFLPAIQPTEAASRGEMSRLLRRKMLQAWQEPSDVAGKPVSWPFYIKHIAFLIIFYGGLIYGPSLTGLSAFLQAKGINMWQAVGLYMLFGIAVTMLTYVYLLYLDKWIQKLFRGKRSASKGAAPSTASEASKGDKDN